MARTIDTSAIDGIIGYRLRRAQVAVFTRFTKAFSGLGITPTEYSVLVLVGDNPGLRPSEVAAVLGIQRANFVSIAASLEKRGLLERRPADDDRRSHALFLTVTGGETERAIRAVQMKFEAEFVAELGGEAERDRLVDLLRKLG